MLFLLALLCGAPACAEPALLDVRAEYAYRTAYQPAAGTKAMAVADNGAFGLSFGQSSPAAAEARALEVCTERSKFYALRQKETPPCRLLARGNEWLLSDVLLDPAWQQPAKTTRAIRNGRSLPLTKPKGIVLMAHGCNGMGANVFYDVWGAYFNAMGYELHAPDSFADKRPKEVCGSMADFPATQVSTVWRLRVAQLQAAIASLRKAKPGLPIYLFGHSEGGLIVQMVEADVAGIIVSGEECGVVGMPVAAPKATPMLYIWGEFDQFVNGVGFRINQQSTKACARAFASHKPQFAIVEGRSHIPWPWNHNITAAIATFLGERQPPKVTQSAVNKKQLSQWKRVKPDKRYRQAAQHRAAAINASGTSYMVWGLDNIEDATQLALFGCTRNTTKRTNVFKTGKYACAVVDVNGGPPK